MTTPEALNPDKTIGLYLVTLVRGQKVYVLAHDFQSAADRARLHFSPDPAPDAFRVQSAELLASSAGGDDWPPLAVPRFTYQKESV